MHKWTEKEVEYCLENYNAVDVVFDVSPVAMSHCKIGHSSHNDRMPGIGDRLLKRAKLSKAIKTLPQIQRYYVELRYIWIDWRDGDPEIVIAIVSGRTFGYIRGQICKGINSITRYLNKKK